jgi:membrane-bound ClpP family serine protease
MNNKIIGLAAIAVGFFGGHYFFGIHWALMMLAAGVAFMMARESITFKEGIFLGISIGIGNTLMKNFLFLDWTQVVFGFAIVCFVVFLKKTWFA